MIHARLGVAEENSGKLVTTVRRAAGDTARQQGAELVVIDGSPGIGCPVIASVTGAHLVLIVTEPTVSGLHDLDRVADLAGHFGVPAMVCINKWDINAEMASRIEDEARSRGLPVAGRIRYDRAVTEAQVHGKAIVEHQPHGAAQDIRELWATVLRSLCDT